MTDKIMLKNVAAALSVMIELGCIYNPDVRRVCNDTLMDYFDYVAIEDNKSFIKVVDK